MKNSDYFVYLVKKEPVSWQGRDCNSKKDDQMGISETNNKGDSSKWWCVYWIVNWSELHESLRTNAVRDASTSQVASHYFGTRNSNKGITLEEMFRMMYKNNFSESALPSSKIMMSSNEVSIEDRKFLRILEKGTVKKDVH